MTEATRNKGKILTNANTHICFRRTCTQSAEAASTALMTLLVSIMIKLNAESSVTQLTLLKILTVVWLIHILW